MSETDKLRYVLEQATANLQGTRQRLRSLEAAAEEPLAIVGMGCRFPGGVRSPEDLWELAVSGAEAAGELPRDRGWAVTPAVRGGGFVYDATEFDPGFFGIGAREAIEMDPQQRLLLQTAWEALERAGIDAQALRGSDTGVFAGAGFAGYGPSPAGSSAAGSSHFDSHFDSHLMTGTATSVLSGRVSYTLGLQGPAVTVDTACSSALVALHLACQSLRAAECSLALVGGAFVAATPLLFTDFSSQLGLSPDGKTKAFAEDADGVGVGEGAGVLVVERLSDARRNGRRVLAVVRGSAVNQDGASESLTAPNAAAQQHVIEAALANARLSAADVDLVEAHGSGTPLGDPVEARALLAAYGRDRPGNRPLWLGSVKSNIGHAQQAAGIAGLMKMVMALHNRVLPRTLHADTPSNEIDWTSGLVRLIGESQEWPDHGRPRRGGVSAFGLSGTNAHVIVEEAPELSEPSDWPVGPAEPVEQVVDAEPSAQADLQVLRDADVTAWLVSGRTGEALAAQAGRLREHVLAHPELKAADVAWSLATTRSTFENRAVVIGDYAAGLAALATGQSATTAAGVVTSSAISPAGRTAVVFPGQGSQLFGMCRELITTSPVFAARLAECAEALAPLVDWHLLDVISDAGVLDSAALATVSVAQPVAWAVMVSLAAVWQASGVYSEAVIGHSDGEIAAATVAGILSLEDGARVVVARAKALADLEAADGMLSVAAPESAVLAVLEETGFAGRIAVAAVDSPAATVVAGALGDLDAFEADLAQRGILRRLLPIADDFVAPSRVQALETRLNNELSTVAPQTGDIAFYSTARGAWLRGADLDAGYWYANLREQVRFADAVVALAHNDYRVFVEVSAQPTLTDAVTESLEEAGIGGAVVTGTVTSANPGASGLLAALARLHVAGVTVDWRAVLGGGARVELPTYAFQNRRYWLPASEPATQTGSGPTSLAEEQFWAAVEGERTELLAGTLSVNDESLAQILPALATWRRRERADSVVSDWTYKVAWAPVSDTGPGALSGTWLIVHPVDQDDITEQCANALIGAGADVVRLQLGPADLDRGAITAHIARTTAAETDLAGIISLLALDEIPTSPYPGVATGLAGSLLLTQALGDAAVGAPLWIVTRDAVAAASGDRLTRPIQAQAWGFGRVVGLEHPERWGGLLDLPPEWDDRTAARLTAVLAGIGAEDQVAVRAAGILGRRLVRPPQRGRHKTWHPRGTVLVTGGTGALGHRLGPWLTARGAERIVFSSPSGPAAADIAELAARLAGAGTRVVVAACDTTRRDEVAGLLGWITTEGPSLSSVLHAEPAPDDRPVAGLDLERLDRTLAAKVVGARWLDELTAGLNLDAFVLFSSIAATWGAGQQPGHAAGDAYLDALAENRLARNLKATSIAYGPWTSGGPAEADGEAELQLARRGLRPLEPALALEALGRALDCGQNVVTIADATWEIFGPAFCLRRRSPLIEALPEVRAALLAAAEAETATAGVEPVGGALAGRLAGLTPVEQDWLLSETIRTEAAAVLGYNALSAVDAGRSFSDLGFDPLTSVELRNRLNAATGLRLPATLLFDHPTPAALADYLRTRTLGVRPGPAATPDLADADSHALDEPVAIVAMGCRYPGGVAGPEDLWQLVAAGDDAVAGLPTDRGWAQNLYDPDPDHSGTLYVREGGFVNGASEFDAAFFGISPREALTMDPQQRLLLEVSWEALERAGINPQTLKGSRTGVYVGGADSGYQALATRLAQAGAEGTESIEGHLATGTAGSVLSGRLSYVLGLEGPAVTLDTAGSSSLLALHLAAQAVRSGECDLALAGGVALLATPAAMVALARQRALAFDGRSKAFAESADGIGAGEGAGLVVLERLSDARRNGHPVLALVRGSAVNQDGASSGLTAPNGSAQQRVIRAALADAQLTADAVDAVEAHGDGTPLGDPIELRALIAAYGQDRPAGRPLWLGSVKSNIGHAQSAAGVAGVIKTVMALRNGLLPQTLHAEEPSHAIDWSVGNVQLVQEPVAWPAGERVRRAGVSAFGMSGTNVHVILEEAPVYEADAAEASAASATPVSSSASDDQENQTPAIFAEGAIAAWPISGRSAEALAGQAGRLREFVLARPALDPGDVGYSLAATRAAFSHRAVVVGSDRAELAARLVSVATDQETLGVVSGAVPPGGAGDSVFVFPGSGSQWSGMGRALLAESPVFAARFAECADALSPYIDWSPQDVLDQAEGAPALDVSDIAEPVTWAVMVALAAVWQAAGVTPDAVLGHSQGEIAAATVAGVLSLDDAARVVVLRSRALAGLGVRGGLLSVVIPESAAHTLLRDFPALFVAAVNSPAATVVSGPPVDLDRFEAMLARRGIQRWRIPATPDFVAHCARVRPIEDQLLDGLSGIRPQPGHIPLYSTAYNRWIPGHELNAAYWYANAREQARFADGVIELARGGHRTFIEVSTQPVLTGAIAECVAEVRGPAPVVTGTVSRQEPGAAGLAASLARVHVGGIDVDWTAVLAGGRRVDLPTYGFQRRRYWLDVPADAALEEGSAYTAGAADSAETRFWAAVESGDVSGIQETLAIDPQRPLVELLPTLASWRRREREDSVVAGWRYRVAWTTVGVPTAAALPGTWLVVTSEGATDSVSLEGILRALTVSGAEVATLELGSGDLDRSALAAKLSEAGDTLSGIMSLLALDESSVADGVSFGLASTLVLVQALGDAEIDAPLWALTQGAVSTGTDDILTSPAQAQLWGLGRVVGLEHPERWGGLIDLPDTWDDSVGAYLTALIASDPSAEGFEDQVAIRSTGILGRRLEHAAPAASPSAWQPRGTVLVTGGTGALGGHVSRWLSELGAERIVLTSSSGPSAHEIAGLVADLATSGTAVEITACEIAQRAEVSTLLARIADSGPALSSVIHTAGVGTAAALAETSPAELASVNADKVGGAALLDELTAGLDLDAFVLFSSAAATWGGGTYAGYAAGNAYLDALAENRRARGLAATSVAWGPWGGGVADKVSAEQLARRGLRLLQPRLAVRALAGVLDSGESVLTVADVDWKLFAPAFVLRRSSPLIAALPEVGPALAAAAADRETAAEPDGGAAVLADRLAGLAAPEQVRILTDLVRAEAAAVLGYPSADDVDPEQAFAELGFDSLTSVEMRNRLSAATGLHLNATLLFDYPNPSALADYLRVQSFQADAEELPLLAALETLDGLLSDAIPDGELHEQVAAKLRRLLTAWSDRLSGRDEHVGRVGSAVDDEIFVFVNQELGRS